MTIFSNSPKILKGGIVLIDSTSAHVRRIILLLYYPDLWTRILQVQGAERIGKDCLISFLGHAVNDNLHRTRKVLPQQDGQHHE